MPRRQIKSGDSDPLEKVTRHQGDKPSTAESSTRKASMLGENCCWRKLSLQQHSAWGTTPPTTRLAIMLATRLGRNTGYGDINPLTTNFLNTWAIKPGRDYCWRTDWVFNTPLCFGESKSTEALLREQPQQPNLCLGNNPNNQIWRRRIQTKPGVWTNVLPVGNHATLGRALRNSLSILSSFVNVHFVKTIIFEKLCF